ncbi:MAG: type II secretion system protein GspG [Candidatus Levybacteria bacterium]|nr:type II secretion system protein GspG [Candidatus Levybacteria bacterium]
MGKKWQKGFSFVEYIIILFFSSVFVFLLIYILNPIDQIQILRDNIRKADLGKLQIALEKYYKENRKYPSSSVGPNYKIIRPDATVADWGQRWQLPYMGTLPKDPVYPRQTYIYYAASDGQSFYIYASLERGSQSSKTCNLEGPCLSLMKNKIPFDACGGICNYAVTSPNVSP